MLLYSGGALLQAEGARRATKKRPVAVQPRYLAGLAADFLAWLCAAGALRELPVFAVQAVVGGAIALTAVGGARLAGARMPGRMRVAVVGCLGGVGPDARTGAGSRGASAWPGWSWWRRARARSSRRPASTAPTWCCWSR